MARFRLLWIALAAAAALVVAGLAVAHSRQPAARTHLGVLTAPPGARPDPAMTPIRLQIPRIGVDAVVEEVGMDSTGSMAVPLRATDVGWYSPGPAPGQPGDAVIDGHLDWYDMPRAVFYDLDQLRPGDEIDVRGGGGLVRFAVTDSRTVTYNSQPAGLFGTTGAARLSLITCAGAWDSAHATYAQRLLVNAKLTSG
jgi:LPXTG-site transpeptidase (sortase) family protein